MIKAAKIRKSSSFYLFDITAGTVLDLQKWKQRYLFRLPSEFLVWKCLSRSCLPICNLNCKRTTKIPARVVLRLSCVWLWRRLSLSCVRRRIVLACRKCRGLRGVRRSLDGRNEDRCVRRRGRILEALSRRQILFVGWTIWYDQRCCFVPARINYPPFHISFDWWLCIDKATYDCLHLDRQVLQKWNIIHESLHQHVLTSFGFPDFWP